MARGRIAYRTLSNSECRHLGLAVGQWGMSFIVERETAQIAS